MYIFAAIFVMCALYIQNVILDEGEQYAGLLYSWRSLSRAVPAVSHFMCLTLSGVGKLSCLLDAVYALLLSIEMQVDKPNRKWPN